MQRLQLGQRGFPFLATQAGTGGVIAGRLLQLGLIAPYPEEILHGDVRLQRLIDGAGQLFQLFRRLIHLDRHFYLDQGAGREDAEELPAPPASGDQQGACQGHGEAGLPASLVTNAAHFIGRQADVAVGYLVAAAGEGGDQGAVADEVDEARDAAGEAVQGLDCPGGEDGLDTARHLQPETHIGVHILTGEWQQVVAGRDALGQLAQQGLAQHLLQLRLADEHHLQQLLLVGLQVGEQAQLLQHAGQQMLGFIHQHHAALARRQIGQQVIANEVEQLLETGFLGVGQLELVTDGRQQIPFGQGRIEDVGDLGLGGQLLEQAARDGGLARAHFPRQQHEAATVLQPVVEVGEGLPVAFAHIEIFGVGRDGERGLRQTEELCVHKDPFHCYGGRLKPPQRDVKDPDTIRGASRSPAQTAMRRGVE
ncbi:hypothetical protein D3C84_457390 [compost metagenome]